MNKADRYHDRARHCMEMASGARHDDDKRSWILLAETWLNMIPESQRIAANRFGAAVREHGAGSRAVNLRVVR